MHHDDEVDRDDLLAAADPIDARLLHSNWSASHARAALFEEITMSTTGPIATDQRASGPVAAGPTAPVTHLAPRRRARRAVWVGAAAAAAIVAAVVGLLPGTAEPAFAVRELPDGTVQIDWRADLRDGDAIARELRSYGLDVSVEPVPSSPSMVGRTLVATVDGFEPDGSRPPGIDWGDDGADDVFTWTIDPAVVTDSITVELAVAAEPGQRYVAAEEVFEPGEALAGLHCTLGTPLRAADVAANADGLELRWRVATPGPSPDVIENTEVRRVPDGEVLRGYAIDDSTVELTVRPDGVELGPAYEPRLSDVPC